MTMHSWLCEKKGQKDATGSPSLTFAIADICPLILYIYLHSFSYPQPTQNRSLVATNSEADQAADAPADPPTDAPSHPGAREAHPLPDEEDRRHHEQRQGDARADVGTHRGRWK